MHFSIFVEHTQQSQKLMQACDYLKYGLFPPSNLFKIKRNNLLASWAFFLFLCACRKKYINVSFSFKKRIGRKGTLFTSFFVVVFEYLLIVYLSPSILSHEKIDQETHSLQYLHFWAMFCSFLSILRILWWVCYTIDISKGLYPPPKLYTNKGLPEN